MANPWFRMYAEFADDPKVQMMSEQMQRRLAMLFCLKCKGQLEGLSDDQIGFSLRISLDDVTVTKRHFMSQEFIDETWHLLNWDKRQFVSDSSTERTRRYRERKRTSQERHGDVIEQNRTESEHKEHELTLLSPEQATRPRPVDFCDTWNRLCGSLPKVESFSDSRQKKVQKRIREGVTLERFEQAVKACTQKPFLCGKSDRGWAATFDWLIENDRNIEKAINEPYGSSNHAHRSRPPASNPLDSWTPEAVAARESAESASERESYFEWLGMSDQFRKSNPWRGPVFDVDAA